MGELSSLPNIGKVVEEQLMQVGVDSAEELKRIGAREAWLRMRLMLSLNSARRFSSNSSLKL